MRLPSSLRWAEWYVKVRSLQIRLTTASLLSMRHTMTMILTVTFLRLPEPPASVPNPPSKVRNCDQDTFRDLENYCAFNRHFSLFYSILKGEKLSWMLAWHSMTWTLYSMTVLVCRFFLNGVNLVDFSKDASINIYWWGLENWLNSSEYSLCGMLRFKCNVTSHTPS